MRKIYLSSYWLRSEDDDEAAQLFLPSLWKKELCNSLCVKQSISPTKAALIPPMYEEETRWTKFVCVASSFATTVSTITVGSSHLAPFFKQDLKHLEINCQLGIQLIRIESFKSPTTWPLCYLYTDSCQVYYCVWANGFLFFPFFLVSVKEKTFTKEKLLES